MKSASRSRDGCWTCRQKKKKCDYGKPSCKRCERLNLHCQGYGVKVLWEDDKIRTGMRRRGRQLHSEPHGNESRVITHCATRNLYQIVGTYSPVNTGSEHRRRAANEHPVERILRTGNLVPQFNPFQVHGSIGSIKYLSPIPPPITGVQSLFFDNYVDNFSMTYPTCRDRSNPFLSCFIPLALRSETVMSALLALSGLQMWHGGRHNMIVETLSLKDSALKGSQKLLDIFKHQRKSQNPENSMPDFIYAPQIHTSEEDDLMLLTGAILMVLIDKLSGASYETLKPHLIFAHYIIQQRFSANQFPAQFQSQYRFLYDLFMYNDLLAALATGGPSLVRYDSPHEHADSMEPNPVWSSTTEESTAVSTRAQNRYYFPSILSRITNGNETVTSDDIDAWNGNMSWLPSFSASEARFPLQNFGDVEATAQSFDTELSIVSNIYKSAAKILLLKRIPIENAEATDISIEIQIESVGLLSFVKTLPDNSMYDNALLFPLSIAAKEITSDEDRLYMLETLTRLENRFQLAHFGAFKNKLVECWSCEIKNSSTSVYDTILLG